MLKYVGNGNFLPGVPARDLTEEEVIQFGGVGRLTGRGLWEAVGSDQGSVVSGDHEMGTKAEKRGGRLNKAVRHGGILPGPGEDK